MNERQQKKRISEASDEEGVLASHDSKEVEFEEGWGAQTTIQGISGTSDIRG